MGGVHLHIAFDIKVLHKEGTLVLPDRDGKAITFSKEHTIQQKVSMITLGALCDLPTHQLANRFGFKTRKSSYDIRNAVLHGSPADLLPKRTAPHTPPQRPKEVEALIIRRRFETEENLYDIADAFIQLGFDVRARRVGQVRADYGLSKKNGSHQRHSQRGFSPRRRPKSSITHASRAHSSSPVTTWSMT